MTGFQRLCLATCFLVFVLIVLGGVVRHTGSGLGCGDDWPRCNGSWIPPFDKPTLIEYLHRLTGTVVGFFGLAVFLVALINYRRIPAIMVPTSVGFVAGLVQAGMGAAVVKNDLSPALVVVHLTLAMSILTLLLLLATTAFSIREPLPRLAVGPQFGRIAALASIGTLALMLVGSYVSGSGYGLACSGWPLCNGDVFPTTNATSVQLIFLHRFLALVVGITLAALLWSSYRTRKEAPFAFTLTVVAMAVYLVQAMLGAATVWTRIADGVVAGHLGAAALLWSVLAVLNIRVHRLYELLPTSSSEASGQRLARLTR